MEVCVRAGWESVESTVWGCCGGEVGAEVGMEGAAEVCESAVAVWRVLNKYERCYDGGVSQHRGNAHISEMTQVTGWVEPNGKQINYFPIYSALVLFDCSRFKAI